MPLSLDVFLLFFLFTTFVSPGGMNAVFDSSHRFLSSGYFHT